MIVVPRLADKLQATMTAEAHRLIKVSLGKIATCRSQRGGINLHKSLLVSKILYKARTAYMMQNLQTVASKNIEKQQKSKVEIKEEKKTTKNTLAGTENSAACDRVREEALSRVTMPVASPETVADKENTPPKDLQNTEMISNTHEKDSTTVNLSKNSESDCTKQPTDLITGCANSNRHLKRGRSETELAVESISPKKAKCESCDAETQVTDTCEPMQAETTQISNLVNIFSSGFSGLISKCEENKKDLEKSDNSCSSQLKEAFETLARPVIALAV